jgi:PhoH-like ATPase
MNGKKPKRNLRKKSDEASMSSDPYLELMQQRGLIEIEAISFIRGRSIPNAFIIIDEAQNLTIHELKTIVTRVGEGTKIVLTGDIEQIDNVDVDIYTNGLTYAIEKFKEHPIAAHVTLLKGERSELATLASKIL